MEDKTVGYTALTVSFAILGSLFIRLLVLPVLPRGQDSPPFEPPIYILLVMGLFGLVFIGSLAVFTLVVMWRNKRAVRS